MIMTAYVLFPIQKSKFLEFSKTTDLYFNSSNQNVEYFWYFRSKMQNSLNLKNYTYVMFWYFRSKIQKFWKIHIYTSNFRFKMWSIFWYFWWKIRRNEVVWKRIWLMTLNLIKSLGRFQYSALCKSEMLKPHIRLTANTWSYTQPNHKWWVITMAIWNITWHKNCHKS